MDINKKLVIEIIIALVILGGIWYINENRFDPSVDPKIFKTASELENYYRNLNELYKKDTYGGSTPEETLALFIDALKKGDVELASKYFVPEKQKKMAEDLTIGLKGGVVSKLLKLYELNNLKKEYIDYTNEYYFNYLGENNTTGFLFKIGFNKVNKIWKIESI